MIIVVMLIIVLRHVLQLL